MLVAGGCSLGQITSTPTHEPPATPTAVPTQAIPAASALDQAISALHGLDYDNLSDTESEEVNAAVEAVANSGSEGARLLHQELTAMEEAGQEDAPFQLLAAWALWEIGDLDEAETIAGIWRDVPAEDWIYELLFMPGLMAASTQDPRALPMLEALTSDKEGDLLEARYMPPLEFPMTHEFLWGAYGSRGLPVLHEMLRTSEDPTVLESAILLLSRAQYLQALPEIREAFTSEHSNVREAATVALGVFGHPDDFDVLIAGLDSSDAGTRFLSVYALVEFGDPRAVPRLIPLLEGADQDVRSEVAWGLGNYLASPEGLEALWESAGSTTDQSWADFCESLVMGVLDSAGLTWEQYEGLPDADREEVTEGFRNFNITLRPGEEAVTHDQLLEVVAEWRETGRISSERWAWVETRHILPVATAEDIDLLLDGKADFYLRLSDECIYDVRIVDDLIRWIGRSRYR
jgi:hypothetical protein